MKQVMIYNQINTEYHGGKRYKNETLFNYFKSQIDWNLYLGWKVEDIVIGTNFDFEYKGVKNHELTDVCDYSGFNNFWYGALELMNRGILDCDYWLHDQDSWANRFFEFPSFEGEIAGCEYIGTPQWNCASVYMKKTCKEVLTYIVELMRQNPKASVSSDEEWIAWCRFDDRSQIKNYMSSINTTYNCGVTHFEKRYENANKPINVFSFKPDKKYDYNIIDGNLKKEMLSVFKKNKLEVL